MKYSSLRPDVPHKSKMYKLWRDVEFMNVRNWNALHLCAVVAGLLVSSQRLDAQDSAGSGQTDITATAGERPKKVRLNLVATTGAEPWANRMAFSPDGTLVATDGDRGAIYDSTSLKLVRSLAVPRDADGVSDVVFSHDGKFVFGTTGNNHGVFWWGTAPGTTEGVWKGDIVGVHSALESGEVVATGSGSSGCSEITLVNPRSGAVKTIVACDKPTIIGKCYREEGGAIMALENRIAGDKPFWIRRIDFAKGTIRERRLKAGPGQYPALYRCGDRAVVCLNLDEVRDEPPKSEVEFWGGPELQRLLTVKIPDSQYVECGAAVGTDLFCVGGESLRVDLFERAGYFTFVDVTTGQLIHREKFEDPVAGVAFSPRNNLLAAVIGRNAIWRLHIWKVELE